MAHSNFPTVNQADRALYSSNQPASTPNPNQPQPGKSYTVDLFDPHQSRRSRPSPPDSHHSQSCYSQTPGAQSWAGIPPLSTTTASSTVSGAPSALADIPPSVQARAGLYPPQRLPQHLYPAGENASSVPLQRHTRAHLRGSQGHRSSGRSRRPISTKHSARDGIRTIDFRYLVAGSSLLAGLVLVGDVGDGVQTQTSSGVCQEVIQNDAVLSRDSLSQLLTLTERENKAVVRDIVSEPYCLLPEIEVRAGTTAQREAYPLAFDPDTWLVVLYEGDEYAGYDFSFQP